MKRVCHFLICCMLPITAVETFAEGTPANVADLHTQQAVQEVAKNVQPVLAKNCHKCHGPKKQKDDLRIDTLTPNLVVVSNALER